MTMTPRRRAMIVASTALTLWANAAVSADAANGKKLYDGKCFACHDTTIHTRPEKIIFSKKALLNRVKMCDANANANWTEQQMGDVVEYLNTTFYKYD